MANLIVRQFTEGRFKSILTQYNKIVGHKSPKVLDKVIPSVTDNLFNSTQSFIEAVINLDSQFIQSTSTHAVQKKLLHEIEQAKRRNVQIKTIPFKNKMQDVIPRNKQGGEQTDLKRFVISPYVIFGQTMKQRFQDMTPWQNRIPILSFNRFTNIKQFSLNNLMTNQVFGFHCHYLNLNQAFQVTQNEKTTECPPRQFVVTFETDSVNLQFFVADFNYIVR